MIRQCISARIVLIAIVVLLTVPAGQRALAADDTAGVVSPNVGIKPVAEADYKPVVGKSGGRVVRDALGEPKSFNPITAGETSTTEFTARIFQTLLDQNPFTGEVRPLLAESFEVAADGVTWTFHLRHGVVFNDGTPLTAHDVEFTWNDLVYDLTRPAGTEERWPCSDRDACTFDGKIIKVEAVDDYTVRFTSPIKIAIFDKLAGFVPVLSKKTYEEMAKNGKFGGALGTDSKPEELVGTGPFMFGEYVRGQKVILKRNPHYWKKDAAGNSLPYLDILAFNIVRDTNTMLIDFQQGTSDVFGPRSGKDIAQLKPKQQEGNYSLYQFGPDDGDMFICFNQNLDAAKEGKIPDYKIQWFRDQRFRQAISLAIDRKAQVKNIRQNLGYEEPCTFTLAAGPFRQDGFAPRPYDPDKAKALLADMGFKPDADGIMHDAQGHELSFTLNTNSENEMRVQTMDFIRKDLEKIGIKVNGRPLEFNKLVDMMDVTFDFDAIVMGLTGGREPHFGANVWKSDSRLHMWWPRQKTPSTTWEKRIDELFTQGIQEMDKAKRKAIYREWVQIAYDQQPFIYLTVGEDTAVLRNRFGNIFPAPIGGLFHNEEEVFVK